MNAALSCIICTISRDLIHLRLGRTIGSTPFEDLERGEFVSEELELLPHEFVKVEVGKDMLDQLAADEAAVA